MKTGERAKKTVSVAGLHQETSFDQVAAMIRDEPPLGVWLEYSQQKEGKQLVHLHLATAGGEAVARDLGAAELTRLGNLLLAGARRLAWDETGKETVRATHL